MTPDSTPRKQKVTRAMVEQALYENSVIDMVAAHQTGKCPTCGKGIVFYNETWFACPERLLGDTAHILLPTSSRFYEPGGTDWIKKGD